jgi:hypothetical protein
MGGRRWRRTAHSLWFVSNSESMQRRPEGPAAGATTTVLSHSPSLVEVPQARAASILRPPLLTGSLSECSTPLRVTGRSQPRAKPTAPAKGRSPAVWVVRSGAESTDCTSTAEGLETDIGQTPGNLLHLHFTWFKTRRLGRFLNQKPSLHKTTS